MKTLTLVNPGAPDSPVQDVDIQPGTTASDILRAAGFDPGQFSLKRPGSEQVFAAEENVYNLPNGSKLFVSPLAEVGIGFWARFFGFGAPEPPEPPARTSPRRSAPTSRTRSASLRRTTSTTGANGRLTVRPDSRPYWEQTNWQRKGDHLHGAYQCGRRAYTGKIHVRSLRFYVLHPPQEVVRPGAPHSACFRPRPEGWYEVHFGRAPRNEDAGIIALESILSAR